MKNTTVLLPKLMKDRKKITNQELTITLNLSTQSFNTASKFTRVKTGEKMASAIFQRKFLRKPSPSALVNYKNQVNFLKENFILSIPILD